MPFSFSDADFEEIKSVLGISPAREGDLVRFELSDEESGRRISIEILTSVEVESEVSDHSPTTLISVYTVSAFLQLQNCTGFIASQELGEVIFFGKRGDAVNGLVIEREAGCSLYANVDEALLSSDFTKLPPEMIMSSMALSMTETLFENVE